MQAEYNTFLLGLQLVSVGGYKAIQVIVSFLHADRFRSHRIGLHPA